MKLREDFILNFETKELAVMTTCHLIFHFQQEFLAKNNITVILPPTLLT
jgi:hypothetical protein